MSESLPSKICIDLLKNHQYDVHGKDGSLPPVFVPLRVRTKDGETRIGASGFVEYSNNGPAERRSANVFVANTGSGVIQVFTMDQLVSWELLE